MANTKGLGKGLSALLGDDVIAAKDKRASSLLLPISQVESCSTQPRKSFEPEALSDLADSIRIHGIIQPLTVRKLQSGYYQIIAGERRWRAARMAGLTQVPVVVIEADDRKAMELAMIENLQREDLNPIEEAEGYRVLSAGNLAHDFRPGFINLHQALGRAAGLNGAAGPEPDRGRGNVHQERKALFVHVQFFHQRLNHVGAVVRAPGTFGNHL